VSSGLNKNSPEFRLLGDSGRSRLPAYYNTSQANPDQVLAMPGTTTPPPHPPKVPTHPAARGTQAQGGIAISFSAQPQRRRPKTTESVDLPSPNPIVALKLRARPKVHLQTDVRPGSGHETLF